MGFIFIFIFKTAHRITKGKRYLTESFSTMLLHLKAEETDPEDPDKEPGDRARKTVNPMLFPLHYADSFFLVGTFVVKEISQCCCQHKF